MPTLNAEVCKTGRVSGCCVCSRNIELGEKRTKILNGTRIGGYLCESCTNKFVVEWEATKGFREEVKESLVMSVSVSVRKLNME